MMTSATAPVRVILDTDIGTDVDDCIALAFLLGSPEIRLEAITTVHADVALRARMTRKLLALRGGESAAIPVYEGIGRALLGLKPPYWQGHEGIGLLEEGDDVAQGPDQDGHAVDFLVEHVLANPGEIHLLAIGPLTNVAAAIIREPRFAASLKHLTIMGGLIEVTKMAGGAAEHNIICDPEAAHVVFSSGAPISLVPLDVTLRAMIDQSGVDALRARQTPYHDAVAEQIARYPGFIERGNRTYLHDPLAAATIVRPELLTWHELNVRVELTGTITRAMTLGLVPNASDRPANARVALDLDRAACEAFIAERIAG